MRQPLRHPWPVVLLVCAVLWQCQDYGLQYQAQTQSAGAHLAFEVQTPSKADLLFVVDNSGSMTRKQQALSASFTQLLATLAPQKLSYRVGIVSTDATGADRDCAGRLLPAVPGNAVTEGNLGARGNCGRPEVLLQRPHDGALGRLVAAYDPNAFAPAAFAHLPPAAQRALSTLVPVQQGNTVVWPGGGGPRYVIDRDAVAAEACAACGCADCSAAPCAQDCAEPVAEALVAATFRSNLAGLGTSGEGAEKGLLAALWAVGIDPLVGDDAAALRPTYNLLAPGANNALPSGAGWLRDDAMLGVVFVTDEEDCSMSASLHSTLLNTYPSLDDPTFCYQPRIAGALLPTARLARLLVARKAGVANRVAVGVVAGVAEAEAGRAARAADCTSAAAAMQRCTCVAPEADGGFSDPAWCRVTDIVSGDAAHPSAGLPGCTGLAARRYVAFAEAFARHTLASICRDATAADGTVAGYGPALQAFAEVLTGPCFALGTLRPAAMAVPGIEVQRRAAGSDDLVRLPQVPSDAAGPGWHYDAAGNRVCLVGLARQVGDAYDVFVLTN